jgi:hypothetical protein
MGLFAHEGHLPFDTNRTLSFKINLIVSKKKAFYNAPQPKINGLRSMKKYTAVQIGLWTQLKILKNQTVVAIQLNSDALDESHADSIVEYNH